MNTIRTLRPSYGSSQEIQINTTCSSTPKLTKSQTFIQMKVKCASSSSKNSTSTKLNSPYQPHQKSQFSVRTHSDSQDAHSILNECVHIFKEIQQSSMITQNEIVLLDVKQKMCNIENIVEEIRRYQNTKNLNQNKISQIMLQIIEEKRQKQQAIRSGENLIKQQANQIQQLVSILNNVRIQEFLFMNDVYLHQYYQNNMFPSFLSMIMFQILVLNTNNLYNYFKQMIKKLQNNVQQIVFIYIYQLITFGQQSQYIKFITNLVGSKFHYQNKLLNSFFYFIISQFLKTNLNNLLYYLSFRIFTTPLKYIILYLNLFEKQIEISKHISDIQFQYYCALNDYFLLTK